MADIAMCINETCTLKETCYRYKATPNKLWQSYTNFSQDKEGICEYYLKVNKLKDE